jgi:hypothetical protein
MANEEAMRSLVMTRRYMLALVVISLLLIGACGPDTIFVRPALDTPVQHVKNGRRLLAQGKLDAANGEFLRAKHLDAGYVPAYVGIALVQADRGNLSDGFETLDRARTLAATPDEVKAVERGYEQLRKMKSALQK